MKSPPLKVIRPRASDGARYHCPCCNQPTLDERGANEVCPVCYWQDEGQDDPAADEVWHGPNGHLSLTQARTNYRQCGAYDPRIGRAPAGDGKAKAASELSESGLTFEDLKKRRKPRAPHAATAKTVRDGPGAEKPEDPSYAEMLESLPAPPAPKPLSRPPRPPSAWTRPLTGEQIVKFGVPLLVLFVAALAINYFVSGGLTREMLKDHGYYLWAHGKGRYERKYLEAFAHDSRFRQRFVGQPVDSLHGLFPWLYGGAPANPDSLRAFNPGHVFPESAPGTYFGAYWLDSGQRGLTYCALLRDGRIVDFFFVERR